MQFRTPRSGIPRYDLGHYNNPTGEKGHIDAKRDGQSLVDNRAGGETHSPHGDKGFVEETAQNIHFQAAA